MSEDISWDSFPLRYRAFSQRQMRARQRRRTRDKARKMRAAASGELTAEAIDDARARLAHRHGRAPQRLLVERLAAAGDPDARLIYRNEMEPERRRHFAEQAAKIREAGRDRLQNGFQYTGQAIGGNPMYRRQPFVYQGLVSNEHPILQLFVTKTRRARRARRHREHALLTGDSKCRVSQAPTKLCGLDDAYLHTIPEMRGVLRVEIDRSFPSWQALEVAITECRVPLPNLAVAHVVPCGEVLRPHLLWLLADSVPFTSNGRLKPKRLLVGILRGLTTALTSLGADPAGLSNPHRHKNPLSPVWHRRIMVGAPYALQRNPRPGAPAYVALADGMPRDNSPQAPPSGDGRASSDLSRVCMHHPDPAINVQSNQLFDTLRRLAYSRVEQFRASGPSAYADFEEEVIQASRRYCDGSERAMAAAASMSRSVAVWTWKNYCPRGRRDRAPLPVTERYRRRADAGRLTAERRTDQTRRKLVEVARRTAANCNQTPTQRAVIAAALAQQICSERTVRRHWPAIVAEITCAPRIPPPVIRST